MCFAQFKIATSYGAVVEIWVLVLGANACIGWGIVWVKICTNTCVQMGAIRVYCLRGVLFHTTVRCCGLRCAYARQKLGIVSSAIASHRQSMCRPETKDVQEKLKCIKIPAKAYIPKCRRVG